MASEATTPSAPPTGEGDNQQQQAPPPTQPTAATETPVVPLPPVLTMGAASFTQQPPAPPSSQQQQGRGGGGRGGGGRQQQQQGRGGRGGGRGTGRGPHQQNQQGRGRGGGPSGRGGSPGVISIAPTTGIPFGHVPAYLPGSSSLVEELDTRILVVLRDGRHLVGILRSFDQYSNMVLDEVSERKIHRSKEGVTYFADMFLGVYIARGDSMVLLGQVGSDDGMKKLEMDELEEMIAKAAQEELEWDFDKDLLA